MSVYSRDAWLGIGRQDIALISIRREQESVEALKAWLANHPGSWLIDRLFFLYRIGMPDGSILMLDDAELRAGVTKTV